MKRTLRIGLLATVIAALLAGVSIAGPNGKAWLGVHTQAVDKDLAAAFNLKTETGAIVNQVAEDSPAAQAGIKEDDIIVSFNGSPVVSDKDLADLVAAASPGEKSTVTVLRNDNRKDISVTLGTRDEKAESDNSDGPKGRVYSYGFGQDDQEYGYVGVKLLGISEELAKHFGADNGGALVDAVEQDSPAQKAELKVGDVIVAVDGRKVDGPSDVQESVRSLKEGDHTRFDVIRDRQPVTVEIEATVRQGNALALSPGLQWFDDPTNMSQIPGLKRLFEDDSRRASTDELKAMQDELKALRRELTELKSNLKQ
jgi:S1-C subfamily serine protease